MSGKKLLEILKPLDIISLSVPVGAVVVSVLVPLPPVASMALIGVILVWFGIVSMTGFSIWR